MGRDMNDPEKADTSDRAKAGEPSRPVTPDAGETREPADPPRTTRGKWTAPKFGSAGSGGAELEPGPERA